VTELLEAVSAARRIANSQGTNAAVTRPPGPTRSPCGDGGLPPMRVFSITDRDTDAYASSGATQFAWDAYHIENYLLEPEFILQVLQEIAMERAMDVPAVERELRDCARATIPSLIIHEIGASANRKVVSAVNTRIDPKSRTIAHDLSSVLKASRTRIELLLNRELSEASLDALVSDRSARLAADLDTDAWKKTFRGREVLALFVNRHAQGVNYEGFRNLIIARMREKGFQPPGMKEVLDKILATETSSLSRPASRALLGPMIRTSPSWTSTRIVNRRNMCS
jgi:hypothetical protein